jgi:hypothetical protein
VCASQLHYSAYERERGRGRVGDVGGSDSPHNRTRGPQRPPSLFHLQIGSLLLGDTSSALWLRVCICLVTTLLASSPRFASTYSTSCDTPISPRLLRLDYCGCCSPQNPPRSPPINISNPHVHRTLMQTGCKGISERDGLCLDDANTRIPSLVTAAWGTGRALGSTLHAMMVGPRPRTRTPHHLPPSPLLIHRLARLKSVCGFACVLSTSRSLGCVVCV